MNENQVDDVDVLLNQWAELQQPSAEHLEAVRQRIEDALKNDPAHAIVLPAAEPSRWRSAAPLLLATAAALVALISAAVWIGRDIDSNVGSNRTKIAAAPETDSIAEPIERFSDEQREQKWILLCELDRLFDGKRVWFAETESDVVLGGDDRPLASDVAAETTVAMRMVLAKRTSATNPWERVWAADVISRSDQVVRFLTDDPQQPTASFTAWAHLLPDGLVACDVDLKWDNGISAQLSDSLLLSPNDTTPGASLSIDGVEYRLFHAVSLLKEPQT
ncbi:hypothetical protein Q31b_08330 [Novipirellula aureliae]|uniref:Uncharacterized protein n=1 Tax=Novipirellula aureliae TaxID=2527966 RepID=A0A5C6ECJ6_9BACT|nr:hypothetical protein [Novipirellula aureliae]TWU45657.1 hypothetical protein Q31b_08330 [Novipirellula aureliae]